MRKPLSAIVITLLLGALLTSCGQETDTVVGQETNVPAPRWEDAIVAYGRGDYSTAFSVYYALASRGHAGAQSNLATMYANGQGVAQSDLQAVHWYRMAADQGHRVAQYRLGVRYAHGTGIPQDDVEAARWYRLAADQGNADARYAIGMMAIQGPDVDYELALNWFGLAAEQGYAAAQYELGRIYADGNGVEQDEAEAMRLYRLAAAQGYVEARLIVDDIFRGLSLAQNVCAQCHAVQKGEAPLPNSDAPTFEVIANTPGMTIISLRILLQTPHRTMPNLVLEDAERVAVSEYILSLN
jgi:TPR repeat protein